MRWPRIPRRRDRSAEGESTDVSDHERARRRMVAEQLEARGIREPDVLEAFRTVPRHAFVEGDNPYGDHAMPVGSGQTISQPYVVARMTQAARPAGPRGWRGAEVLEVGTGSGYQAAILAELGARVTTIERHPELASGARHRLADAGYGEDRVRVVVGDGTEGWPEGAPYRSVVVTAGGPSVPKPLLDQLHPDGGRLVMPVGDRYHQYLTVVVREGTDLRTTELEPVVFVPLIGRFGVQE
jgi:protein-L-isoaspartate(D-aspartate) O-methyltransferase